MESISSVDTITSTAHVEPFKLPAPIQPKIPKLNGQPKSELQLLKEKLISFKKLPTVQKAIKKLPVQKP